MKTPFRLGLPTIALFSALLSLDAFAINWSSQIINGNEFPVISRLKSAGGVCLPYERRTKARAPIDIETKGANKNWTPWIEGRFTAPNGWTIDDLDLVTLSAANTRLHEGPWNVNNGQKTLITSEFKTVENRVTDYIFSLDLEGKYKNKGAKFEAELISKFHKLVESYQSLAVAMESTDDVVWHRARVRNNGVLKANVRSWWRGHISVTEVCLPPEITSAPALESTLKSWTIAVVDDFEEEYAQSKKPIANWTFENYSAADVTGNGNNGTWVNYNYYPTGSGAIGTAAYTGNAGNSNGKGYVKIANTGKLNNLAQFTLAAWVYPTSNTTGDILAKVNPNRDFLLQINNSGQLSVHHAQGSTYYTCTSSSSVPTNAWTHVAATWENYYSGGYWRLYVNGQYDNTCSASTTPKWTGNNISIGSLQYGSQVFNGRIDEVNVFDYKMSTSEVNALFKKR
ncbi:LamG domain-containing protein [Teredinibacter franksiae]|uniref:LamG domain-containing protein n=1 Tax=Teredinibacter franksiae TaxID=2761453 RepID=UPI001623875C|nr:LamG domain-containing protein [Teredinibacter franksiae]